MAEQMSDDFFGSLYVELETQRDQLGWLAREGISPTAWLSFLDFLRAEVRDALLAMRVPSEEAFDAAVAAAMQVAWEGSKRAGAARRTAPERMEPSA